MRVSAIPGSLRPVAALEGLALRALSRLASVGTLA